MKAFSELTSASQVNNSDLLAISQENSGSYASKKTTVKEVTNLANLNLAEKYDSTSSYAVDDFCIYESVLYKCTASTTGAFDSTKWTQVVITDEMGSGGGGTGGHTIINENGNSMTARSGLQFFGAVEVTDDSANNRTLVEVLGGDFYNPVIYSTEEREIGVYSDGKPLYQITIDCGACPNKTEKSVSTASLNLDIDFVASLETVVYNSTTFLGYKTSDRYVNNQVSVEYNKSDEEIILGCRDTDQSDLSCIVTIKYTKTTDTAGSGTWTPQGVPAVHYSTDEQVIGTWIDGRTIYGKLFELENTLTINADSWGTTSISNSDKAFIVDARLYDVNGTFFGQVGANCDASSSGSQYVQILNSRNAAISINKIYLEYIKSS